MAIIKLNNRAVKDATAVGTTTQLGNLVFISKQTASSSASVSFTSGIDSTYKEYIFYFNNIHPQTLTAEFLVNFSTDSGSNYNVTKTTTFFTAYHREDGLQSGLVYEDANDLAQSTSYHKICNSLDADADEGLSGSLTLFEPSSSVFVKHFMTDVSKIGAPDVAPYGTRQLTAGYGNTTSAINAIDFKMSSGNIDSGEITLFGVA